MIKRIVSFCGVVFLFGTIVDAAEIKVRTAEHNGFTRIVLDYENTPTPKIEPKDGGLRVSFDVDVKFDLDTFFNRLSKNRLQPPKVNARNNQIEFNFDCDCGFEISQNASYWFWISARLHSNHTLKKASHPLCKLQPWTCQFKSKNPSQNPKNLPKSKVRKASLKTNFAKR